MQNRQKYSFVFIAMVVTFALLASTFQPVQAATVPGITCTQWHVVERGETLSKIAVKYDTTWLKIAQINGLKDPNLIFAGNRLCVTYTGVPTGSTPIPVPTWVPTSTGTIRVYADNVVEDKTVTLRGIYLNPKSTYTVYLGKYKADLTEDVLAGTALTDQTGKFLATYRIPKSLVDVSKIRVYIKNKSGDSASNWFINATSNTNTGGVASPPFSFVVESVRENKDVTIKTSNLPVNAHFLVTIGKSGSKGVDGIVIGSVYDNDGIVKATFNIPEEYYDRTKLDIRLENKSLGMYYYQPFENK